MWWGDRKAKSAMTEPDRMILMALAQYESDLCECGHPRSETMDPAHDHRDPEHVARYIVGAPFECLACGELSRVQAEYAKAHGQDGMAALKFVAELIPRGYRPA